MARAEGLLVVAVEVFSRRSACCSMHDLNFKLHTGTRTLNCSAPVPSGRQNSCAARISAFEIEILGEDDITLELSDGNTASNDPIGTAFVSLSRAITTGSDHPEVPVLGTTGDPEPVGVLSLSLKWTPAGGSTSTSTTSEPAASAAAGSRPSAAASAFAASAAGGAAPDWMKSLEASISASPAATEQPAPSQEQQPAQQQLQQQELQPQQQWRPQEHEPQCQQRDDLPGPPDDAAAAAAHTSAPASAASATVMAAMVAVAAMVAAATELPATSPRPSPPAATAGGGSSALNKAACRSASAGGGTFYPPIQPYDAAPPQEFGPGSMPSSSGGTAPGFYPDIALRLHFPADVSVRLDQLRTPVTSSGA